MKRRDFLKCVSAAGAGALAWSAGGWRLASAQTFSNEIIIAGQAVTLGGDIRVVNFRDNPDYSFFEPRPPHCPEPEGGGGGGVPGLSVPGTGGAPARLPFSYREGLSRRQLESMTPAQQLGQLREEATLIVLHDDGTYTAHQNFSALCHRGLSTHFLINHDGGIIQGLDPLYVAYHAGEHNARSVGVDLNVGRPDHGTGPFQDPLFGGQVDYSGRAIVESEIGGVARSGYAYTEAQYASLCALLSALNTVLDVPLEVPRDDAGGVLRRQMTEPSSFAGVVGHFHISEGKYDPGPGFGWERVMNECVEGAP